MISAARKAKLTWQCRRGMLELDLILNRFLTEYADRLTDKETDSFEQLLQNPDPELYAWLMGSIIPTDRETGLLIEYIRNSHTIT